MPKSQIIKDIVENRVPLEQSLNRLYILAADVKNTQLAEWAQKELNGYAVSDTLPEYRRMKCFHFKYSGLNGGFQVTKIPLPTDFLKVETLEKYSKISMYDGIRYIEELSNSNKPAVRNLTFLAGEVAERTDDMVSCISIYQEIPQSIPQGICATVKNKMIIALLELEKRYGDLDPLGIDISERSKIQVEADNEVLNRSIFNINIPANVSEKRQPWYSKIAWNIVVPIITAILGAVIAAIIIHWLNF